MAKKATKRKKLTIFICITIAIILVICAYNVLLKLIYRKEYSEYVSKYAKEYNVDENLIYALIKAESNFDVNAVSNRNAKGLMQLMMPTAQEAAKDTEIEVSEENILNPEINIMLGVKYLSTLLERYECIEIAIAAYNAGMTSVDKWIDTEVIKPDGSDIENIPFKETNNYVRKIMRDYDIYCKM